MVALGLQMGEVGSRDKDVMANKDQTSVVFAPFRKSLLKLVYPTSKIMEI